MWKLLFALLFFSVLSHAQIVFGGGGGSGGSGSAAIACAGTPGNTAGAYRQQCQTAGGVIYACNNSAGCTVASDWVAGGGAAGPAGPGYAATSTTSLTLGIATQTLTTQLNLAYSAGAEVLLTYTGNTSDYMYGTVTSYSGTTLVVATTGSAGSGTFASWNINLIGLPGQPGSSVPINITAGTSGAVTFTHNLATSSHEIQCFDNVTGQVVTGWYVSWPLGTNADTLNFPVALVNNTTCIGTAGGSGGGSGSAAFSSLTGGTNSTAGMIVGAGAMFAINYNAVALPSPLTGTVLQLGNADAVNSRLEMDSFGGTAFFTARTAAGTNATPLALTSGQQIGGFNAVGYNGSAYVGPNASFRTFANQAWTVGANGTYADIATTANGSTTLTQVCQFENDAGVTCPHTVTGGDKGAGTINAAGLYVNGTAVNALAVPIPSASGGTGISNTATLTLGTSNQNWATLGTGIVKNTTTTGALTDATLSDITSLFTGTCTSAFVTGAGACVGYPLAGTYGGTGINNGSNTLTLSGSVTFTGAFNPTFSIPASATYTFPSATATLAALASPAFTGTPAAPTQTTGDNTTALATDAFVNASITAATGFANTTLSNLGTVSLNSALLFQSAKSLGSATAPPQNLFFYGSGTYGSQSVEITGTPAGNNVWTVPNTATDTFAGLGTTQTFSGPNTFSYSGTNGTPALKLTGTVYTSTNPYPQLDIDTAGATEPTWNPAGVMLGVNAPSMFAGNLISAYVNGVFGFSVNSSGTVTANHAVMTGATSNTLTSSSAAVVPLVINNSAGSPTGNLTNWQSGGSNVATMSIGGALTLNTPLAGAYGGLGIANTGYSVTLAGVGTGPTLSFPGSNTYTFPSATSTLAILGANTFTGQQIISTNSASATAPLFLTGSTYAGANVATLLIEPSGTTNYSSSANGSMLGLNAPSGYTGYMADLQVSGASVFRVNASGVINSGETDFGGPVRPSQTSGGSPILIGGYDGTYGYLTLMSTSGVTNYALHLAGSGASDPEIATAVQTNPIVKILDATNGYTAQLQVGNCAPGGTGGNGCFAGTLQQGTEKSCSTGLTTDSSGNINGCVASDERLKTNIQPLDETSALMSLSPRFYNWKDAAKRDGKVHAGFVAQEVERVFPQAVVSAGGNGDKGVDPNAILALTVEAVQKQARLIEQLQAEIQELKAK
jgi:hypothetical protein